MKLFQPWREPSVWPEHRALLAISLPMILSNITVPLLGLVDTAVVGHLADAYFLGGTAVGSMLITLVLWLAGFLRMTTTGLAAQSYGGNQSDAAVVVLWRGIVVAGAIALVMLLLQQPLIRMGLAVAGGSEEVQLYAERYVQIRVWGFPAALMNLVILGWLLGMQKARLVMWLLILTNVINIGLDLLFVPVFGWQVQGVALATLIAEYAALGMGLWLVLVTCKARGMRLLPNWALVLDPITLGHYGRLNRDVLIRTLCLEAVFAFMTFQGARLGDTVVAANAILMGFLLLISFGLDGIAYGAEARVGMAKGARNPSGIRMATTAALYWTGVFALAYALFFALAGTGLLRMMSSVPSVVTFAQGYLWWMVALPLIACWCYLYDGIYIGLTRASVMRNSMILSTFGIFFPVWLLLSAWDNAGLWVAFSLFMAVRGLTLGWHYHRMNDDALLQ